VLKKGVKVSAACERRCNVMMSLRDKKSAPKSKTLELAAGGHRTVTLKPPASARRSLLRRGRARLTVNASFAVEGRWRGTWLVVLDVRRRHGNITVATRTINKGLAKSPAGPGSLP